MKCKRCKDTGWCPALEPYGPFIREVKGIKEICDCEAGQAVEAEFDAVIGKQEARRSTNQIG